MVSVANANETGTAPLVAVLELLEERMACVLRPEGNLLELRTYATFVLT